MISVFGFTIVAATIVSGLAHARFVHKPALVPVPTALKSEKERRRYG